MYFYESSVSESQMHMALRCEAGLVTEKCTAYSADGGILSPESIWNGTITTSGVAPAKRISANDDVSMMSKGLLSHTGRRQLSAELRAVDPVSLLRLRQIVHHDASDHQNDALSNQKDASDVQNDDS